MITRPIIPIWLMIIICLVLLIISFSKLRIFLLRLLMIVLLFLANLRIMIPNGKTKTIADNLDILFVIDTTISMIAEDYDNNETRLSAVKKDCEYIIEELSGSKFSIITFDSISDIRVPFTYDSNIAKEMINMLTPTNRMYATGSTLNLPIQDMEKQFKSSQKEKDRYRILFYISDGEITKNEKLESFTGLASYIKNGAILGYGTNEGGYMKNLNKSYYNKEEYIIDSNTSKRAISKIDEDNLKQIANDLKLDYIKMNKTENLTNKIEEIKNDIILDFEENEIKYYEDTYYYFIIPFIVLVSIDFMSLKRKS